MKNRLLLVAGLGLILGLILMGCTFGSPQPVVLTSQAATATPAPGPVVPPSPSSCTLNSAFVADVSVPAGTLIGPGQAFSKVWRLMNTGTCTWEAGTILAFVGGTQMGPIEAGLPTTPHGDTVDVGVTLTAPTVPGTYQGIWQLKDAAGEFFGTQVAVVIDVPAPGTPIPTPATPLPPEPQPSCALASAFVTDVTIPDGTLIGPGQLFYKVWRLSNTGDCPWDSGTSLVFISGEQMGGPSATTFPLTQPGGTVDIGVTLYAPTGPGQHQGVWQLRDAEGQMFGVQIDVVINVPGPNTPTPPPVPTPTPVPGPSISFWADNSEITIGTCTVVHWSVSNDAGVQFNQGQGWESVNENSSRRVCPAYPTTYRLLVTDLQGGNHERTLTIQTVPPPPGLLTPTPTPPVPPPSISFTADKSEVTIGTCTTVRWTVQNASNVWFYDGKAWQQVNLTGSQQVCPAYKTAYDLDVENLAGGHEKRNLEIRTIAPPPGLLTPTPTRPSPKPSISFSADRSEVTIGTCTTVRWRVENAARVRFFDGQNWLEVDENASQHVCPAYPITYRLSVTDLQGGTEERSLEIKTQAPPPGLLTPTPTRARPGPSISFWADNMELTIGTCTNLRWRAENATKARLYDGKEWRDVNLDGAERVCPAYPTTYRLEVTAFSGGTQERSVEIGTQAPPPGLVTPSHGLLKK